MEAFLTCRCQRVVINGQFSSWLPVIPQGSVLSPLLFLLYINDIFPPLFLKAKSNCLPMMSRSTRKYPLLMMLNCFNLVDLSNIVQWAKSGFCILIHSNVTVLWFPTSVVQLYHHTVWIRQSFHPVVRYLGVLVDSKLSWTEHCKYISAKATRSLKFLRHCLYNASTSIKSTAYRCIIHPVLEYACPDWHPHTAKTLML